MQVITLLDCSKEDTASTEVLQRFHISLHLINTIFNGLLAGCQAGNVSPASEGVPTCCGMSWCTLNRRGHWHSSSCAGLGTQTLPFYCSSAHTLSSSSALNVRKESLRRVNELHLLSLSLWGQGNPLAPGGNQPLSFELHLLLSGAAPVNVFLKNSAVVSFFCTDIMYSVHKLR